ncbi:CdaR family protein [Deferribacter thermophilus]|uniref:CdaR family protein n=1 Tax=Deferribacter thermophilus TaxID=53573 RepID=UPI003C20B44B
MMNLILKNLELKIISVIMALFFWFIVVTSDYKEASYDVPIVLENLNKGLIAVYDTNLVRVTVKGPDYILKNIKFSDLKVRVNADLLKYGKNRYIISNQDVSTPKGVEIVNLDPRVIVITIDKLVEKQLKVVPVFIGSPKLGYKVKNIKVYPNTVKVKGAENSIKDMKTIETLPIDLNNKFRDLTYNIAIRKVPGLMEVEPAYIDVVVKFMEDIVTKKINLPVSIINKTDYNADLLDNEVSVEIKGRKDLLEDDRISEIIKVYVDLSDIKSQGRFLLPVKYDVPEKVTVLRIKPSKVRVEVKK